MSGRARNTVMLAVLIGMIALSVGVAQAQPAATARPPANDNVAKATRVRRLPFTASGSSALATTEVGDPNCAGNGGHTVWFVLQPSTDTTLDADTFGSTYDTTLSAYVGKPGAWTQIACNDDAFGIGAQSEIIFPVKAHDTVYLMVASYGASVAGSYTLSVSSTTNNYPRHPRCGHPDQLSVKNRCAGSTPYMLSVGDSAPVWNGGRSYPDLVLRSKVTRSVPGLKLVKTACSSETSVTFLQNSLCGGSQYQKALDFLSTNRGHVALITIDIGGNDVVFCATAGGGIDWACALQALQAMKQNVQTIVKGLRFAAPNTPIVGMNYYDPYLGDWLQGPDGQAFAKVTLDPGLKLANQWLQEAYASVGVPWANVQDAFHSFDLTTMVPSQWGTVPLAVERACTLLTITCVPGQYMGFGDDPNVEGAKVIAQRFVDVIQYLWGRVKPPR